MKIVSWNVNGVRAIVKKQFVSSFLKLDADVVCLQETKATSEQVSEALSDLSDYHIYSNDSKRRKGYAGTSIISKQKPISVTSDINDLIWREIFSPGAPGVTMA